MTTPEGSPNAGTTGTRRPRRVLAVAGAITVVLVSSASVMASAPPVDPPGESLGDDPTLDALVTGCADGALDDCDQLFLQAPLDSDYERYGDTCGDRQAPGTETLCVDAVFGAGPDDTVPGDTVAGDTLPTDPVPGDTAPADTVPGDTVPADTDPSDTVVDDTLAVDPVVGTVPPGTQEPDELGSDPALNELAGACYLGDMAACDDLYELAYPGSEYRAYADTCAGRQPEGTQQWCAISFPGAVPDLGPPDTQPVDTQPDDTQPDVTEPVDTQPADTTQPDDTQPDETQPDETQPDETQPVDTDPDGTAPDDTAPDDGVPPATIEPDGLGDDPELNALAEECYAGDLRSCDELFDATSESADDIDYTVYADTCAGRQPENTGRWCLELESGGPIDSVPTDSVPTDSVPTDSTSVPDDSLPPLPTGPDDTSPDDTSPDDTGPVGVPDPTIEPTGLGDDADLDALAAACYDGDLQVCDELYFTADIGSEYFEYADTCAGRQEPDSGALCVGLGSDDPAPDDTSPDDTSPDDTSPDDTSPDDTMPNPDPTDPAVDPVAGLPAGTAPGDLGDDTALAALADSCYAGQMVACDDLFDQAPLKSDFQIYGDTCGGRQKQGTFVYCTAAFPAVAASAA